MGWNVTIAIAYHLNGSAERHLKKVNGCQDGCWHLSPRPTESKNLDYTDRFKIDGSGRTSPWEKCRSPTERFAPLTKTGK